MLGNCFGPGTTLIGDPLGLGPKKYSFVLKKVGYNHSVVILVFLGAWTYGFAAALVHG